MCSIKGNISSIESMGLLDGPGVRVVVFMQGCPLRCMYCHNPETWDYYQQKSVYTPLELAEYILRYREYIVDGGVTFSGGEPMMQSEFLYEVCKILKSHNIHIAIDTSGAGEYNEALIDIVDLIIMDIKSTDSDMYRHITLEDVCVQNTFVQKIQAKNKSMWIRQVIVPGMNDNMHNINNLYNYIKTLKNVQKVELLPYSRIGVSKYQELDIPYRLKDTENMDISVCNELESTLFNMLKNI